MITRALLVFFSIFVFAWSQQGLNDISLIKPVSSNPAVVLANSDVETIIIELSVVGSNGQPVKNLGVNDFNVTVGGENASILTVLETDIKYFISVKLPKKSEGKYDLRVQATNSKEAVETEAIEYTKTGKQNIDVVLVIDKSGSMYGQPLDDAKNAAKTFVDQMNLDDQIGVVSFDDSVYLDFPLTLITDQTVKDNTKQAIDNIISGGWTSIGGGLKKASEELVNKGRQGIPHFVILLSDGDENASPYTKDVLPDVIQNNITVYTVGFGGVDDNLMSNIATQTGGQYLKAPSSQDLQSLYSTIAGKIIQRETIAKENVDLNPGETKRIPIPVDPSLTRVLFFFEWLDPNQQFDVKLEDPNGNIIDKSICSQNCVYTEGSTYIHYDIENPIPGTWNLVVSSSSGGKGGGGGKTERPSLSLEVVFTKPLYAPGENIVAFATITDAATSQVITGATVTGTITLPNGSVENVQFHDDGTNGDVNANDGIYTLVYSNTNTEGLYTLNVSAQGIYQGYDFSRDETISTYVQSLARIFIPTRVVEFGAVDPQAQYGTKKQIVIYNIGGSDLEVQKFSISGNNVDDFTIINNMCVDQNGNPIAIKPNNYCVLEVEFKPQDYGDREATLSMNTNDANNSTYSIKLVGKGVSITPVYIENVDFNPGCAPKPFTVDFKVKAKGGLGTYKYKWDFNGDGTPDEITDQDSISYTFDTEGTYNVKLIVEDAYDPSNYREADMTICVLELPSVGIDKLSANPVTGVAPLTVGFDIDAKGGSGNYIYEWDFDNDGNIDSKEENPTYTYANPGQYTATVVIKDANDPNNKTTGKLEIIVVDKPEVISAGMTVTPASGEVPLDVTFTLQISGGSAPYTIEWDFGDGSTETQIVNKNTATITHTYTTAGTYNVTAQVYSNTSDNGYGVGTVNVQTKLVIKTETPNDDTEPIIVGGCNTGASSFSLFYLVVLVLTAVRLARRSFVIKRNEE